MAEPAGEAMQAQLRCPACGREQRPLARSSSRFATPRTQPCTDPGCGALLLLRGDRWTLADRHDVASARAPQPGA
jgi:hypothetical protein